MDPEHILAIVAAQALQIHDLNDRVALLEESNRKLIEVAVNTRALQVAA